MSTDNKSSSTLTKVGAASAAVVITVLATKLGGSNGSGHGTVHSTG